jgi:hypothetical protein
MENQLTGYPIEVFYAAAVIGFILVLFSPRWAFYFCLFGLAIRHYHLAVFTRTPFLGEFVNLNDLFVWIGVGSMLRAAFQGQKIWAPKILLAIIGILLLGSFQSLFQYGFDNLVLKSMWAAWIFPIMFVVSANMVKNTQDARYFYWTLFFGALGAALTHLFFIQANLEEIQTEVMFVLSDIRIISFIMSGGIYLVISAFFIDMRKIVQNKFLLAFWAIGLALISVSYILSYTRTVWIGAFMAGVAMSFLFYRECTKVFSRLRYTAILLVILFLVFKITNAFLVSNVNVTETVDQRADFMRYQDSFDAAYQSRESGMEKELKLWEGSTIIWGVGASYPLNLVGKSVAEVGALHHVGLSSYLAHFGLIGLITYGFFLPFLTIKVARRYYYQHMNDFGGAIAVTTIALSFYDLFTIMSSNHYLIPTGQIAGLIYGALWGLSRSLQVSLVRSPGTDMRFFQGLHRWLPEPVKQ